MNNTTTTAAPNTDPYADEPAERREQRDNAAAAATLRRLTRFLSALDPARFLTYRYRVTRLMIGGRTPAEAHNQTMAEFDNRDPGDLL